MGTPAVPTVSPQPATQASPATTPKRPASDLEQSFTWTWNSALGTWQYLDAGSADEDLLAPSFTAGLGPPPPVVEINGRVVWLDLRTRPVERLSTVTGPPSLLVDLATLSNPAAVDRIHALSQAHELVVSVDCGVNPQFAHPLAPQSAPTQTVLTDDQLEGLSRMGDLHGLSLFPAIPSNSGCERHSTPRA